MSAPLDSPARPPVTYSIGHGEKSTPTAIGTLSVETNAQSSQKRQPTYLGSAFIFAPDVFPLPCIS